MFKTDDQRAAYYSSGYASLSDFLEKAFSLNMALFEAKPESAYDGTALTYDWDAVGGDMRVAKEHLLRHAASLITDTAPIYIEFGVRAGWSMGIVADSLKQADAVFFGLDTFTGLPDGWVPAYGNRGRGIGGVRKAGDMAVKNVPDFDDRRILLMKGLFQDSLPLILSHIGQRQLFINIDGDTYTAALYGLTMLHPYLKSGDILYFDEFVDELNEYAAFNDYVRSFYLRDRLLPIARAYDGFLFQLTDLAK